MEGPIKSEYPVDSWHLVKKDGTPQLRIEFTMYHSQDSQRVLDVLRQVDRHMGINRFESWKLNKGDKFLVIIDHAIKPLGMVCAAAVMNTNCLFDGVYKYSMGEIYNAVLDHGIASAYMLTLPEK